MSNILKSKDLRVQAISVQRIKSNRTRDRVLQPNRQIAGANNSMYLFTLIILFIDLLIFFLST